MMLILVVIYAVGIICLSNIDRAPHPVFRRKYIIEMHYICDINIFPTENGLVGNALFYKHIMPTA